jgi:demethylmenaquinone methyltransferase/2-methoxy-6-polyprenyl-1,4-benzoquinol methylase
MKAATTDVRRAYTDSAHSYDARTGLYQEYRKQLVAALPLKRGDVVLDVGCGTGLCLPLLAERVGPQGAVIGIDESPQMLAEAERRVSENGLQNVELIESRAEDLESRRTANAALFCAVHDILRSRSALERVFGHLVPGAWVAAGGGKWAPSWMGAVNALVYATHEPFVRDFEGFDRPWSRLERFVNRLRIHDQLWGYVALGQNHRHQRHGRPEAVPA